MGERVAHGEFTMTTEGKLTKGRAAVRAPKLRAGDVLVFNEGTSLPVTRMTVSSVDPRERRLVRVTLEGQDGRARLVDYERSEVLQVERVAVPVNRRSGHG
jgi:hypothetical protein